MRARLLAATTLAPALLLASGGAMAQVTLKPDGQWRHLVTAGLNVNRGNSESTALNLATDSVRATDSNKWSVLGQALYASSGGVTTGERLLVSSQYNTDISWSTFAFVQGAGLRDKPANIRDRFSLSSGLGWHLMKREQEFWDVWVGLSVAHDRYVNPTQIQSQSRSTYTDSGMVLAEESSQQLSANTRLKQKLAILPSLRKGGQYRAEFDSQLAVSINASLSLSTGLSVRHNSHPAPGVKKTDTALVTGLSYRFD